MAHLLQMKDSGFDLFCLSGVPEILSQITTGSSGHVHTSLIFVMALRAFPFHIFIDYDLTVKTAFLAII